MRDAAERDDGGKKNDLNLAKAVMEEISCFARSIRPGDIRSGCAAWARVWRHAERAILLTSFASFSSRAMYNP
jgi:hypothetical protein